MGLHSNWETATRPRDLNEWRQQNIVTSKQEIHMSVLHPSLPVLLKKRTTAWTSHFLVPEKCSDNNRTVLGCSLLSLLDSSESAVNTVKVCCRMAVVIFILVSSSVYG